MFVVNENVEGVFELTRNSTVIYTRKYICLSVSFLKF